MSSLLNRLDKLESRLLPREEEGLAIFVRFVASGFGAIPIRAECCGRYFDRWADESVEQFCQRVDAATLADANPPNARLALLFNEPASQQ